jgi:hypothetical protein
MARRTRRVKRPPSLLEAFFTYVVLLVVLAVCFVFFYLYLMSLVR